MRIGKTLHISLTTTIMIAIVLSTIVILINFIDPQKVEFFKINSNEEYSAFRVKIMSIYISECLVLIALAVYLNLTRERFNLTKLWVSVFFILLWYITLSFLIQGSNAYGWDQISSLIVKVIILVMFIPVVYATFANKNSKVGNKIA
jgi:hypothetical protein